MDGPLLPYIDVRHANLLPPSLTVGEAKDLGPQYTTADDIALVRDASANIVSQCGRIHMPVGKTEAPIQAAEPAAVESVNSSEAEAN